MKNLIREMFHAIFEDLPSTGEAVIAKYFSKNYIQHVDGKTLDYSHFVKHIEALKNKVKSVKIEFKHILEEGNQVVTLHHVHATKKNGEEIIGKVIAYFQIEDGKIVLCDELTHIAKGSDEDRNLGSEC